MRSEFSKEETRWMRRALALAKRGYGRTSPNPMVGAALVKDGKIIGEGFHHGAGLPHAEIEALRDAEKQGHSPEKATLFVTLEPCSTHGRTPPCTEAILKAGISEAVIAASDPNPKHAGAGLRILSAGGVRVRNGLLERESAEINAAFNHWIVHRTPYVTVKSAMSMDGKIATSAGESKWITSERARAAGLNLRRGCDAILVGIQTLLADDPSLTIRSAIPKSRKTPKSIRRFILDSDARTPLTAKVVSDDQREHTTILVSDIASNQKIEALEKLAAVWRVPRIETGLDLPPILKRMGQENITSLLVEGGGETIASFFAAGLAHRVFFFYAPMVIGGRAARKSVAGAGFTFPENAPRLKSVRWRRFPPDLLMTAEVEP